MADKTVQETLKDEGQLVRNTGTNSIKSVKERVSVNTEKLEGVLSTISDKMTSQLELMERMVDLREVEIENSAEQRENLLRQQRLEDVQKSDGGLSQPSSSLTNEENQKNLPDLLGDFIASGVGMITGLSLAGIVSTVVSGGFTVGVGALLGNFLEGAIEQSLNNLEFGEETSQTAANSIKDAVIAGSIGTIFGKKIGAFFAAGSLISDVFGLDEVTKKIGEQFENEFVENQAGKIGTALGAGLALAVAKKGGLRSKLVGGIATALVLFGDSAKQWLEDQGMPEDWAGETVTTTSTIANFATVGAMFGAKGAIVGAALGFVYSLGKNIHDWLVGFRDEQFKDFMEDVESIRPLIEKARSGEELTEEERKSIARVRSEATRQTRLAQPDEQIETARDVKEETTEILGQQPLRDDGIDPAQMRNRVERALDGETDALLDIINYLERRNDSVSRDDLEEIVKDFGESTINEAYQMKEAFPRIKEWEKIVDQAFENSFKMGSNGFQDFGRASLAILHGKEAVVPQSTPAGAFLSDYFTENWQPKSALAEKTIQLAQESAAISTSPRPVVVRGGDSLAAPVTNNNSQTTIVNNTVDPSRSLNHIPT